MASSKRPTGAKKRGFQNMTHDQHQKVAQQGGKAPHVNGRRRTKRVRKKRR
jgi:hypothetical protein